MDSSTATDADILLAHQLLRFIATNHPNASLADEDHITYADRLSARSSTVGEKVEHVIPYPLCWAESKTQFRTFLRNWKIKLNREKSQASLTANRQAPPADIPLPETPGKAGTGSTSTKSKSAPELELSQSSSSHSPPSAFDHQFLAEPRTQDTLRQLKDLSLNSPSIEFPRSGENGADPDMALTPQAAADLIAAAFERHKTDISEIVARTVTQIQKDVISNSPSLPPQAPLKADEVGYFNPSLKDADGSGVVSHGKQTIYTDVWAFTDRLSSLAESVGELKVKAVWTTCLQATALAWHSTELSELEKSALHTGSVQQICQNLQARFKKNHSDALTSLQQSRFTLRDLAEGRTLRPFIQRIIRDSKSCNYSTENQLLAAFEALDPEIQGQLTKPTSTTSLGAFLTQVDDRESVLSGKARQIYGDLGARTGIPVTQPVSAYYGKQQFHNPQPFRPFPNLNRPYGGEVRAQEANRGTLHQTQTQTRPYSFERGRGNFGRYNNSRGGGRFHQQMRNPQSTYSPYLSYPAPAQRSPWPQSSGAAPAQSSHWTPSGRQASAPQLPRQTSHTGRPYPNSQQTQSSQPPLQPSAPNTQWGAQGAYWGATQDGNADSFPQAYIDAEHDNSRVEESSHEPALLEEQVSWDQSQQYMIEDPILTSGPIPETFGPPLLDDTLPHQDAAHFGLATHRKKPHICHICAKEFKSNNRLHSHIRREHKAEAATTEVEVVTANVAVACEATVAAATTDKRMKIDNLLQAQEPTHSTALFHTPPNTTKSATPIVESSVDSAPDVGTGFTYKSKTYLRMYIMTDPVTEREQEVVGDTGCTRTLADADWAAREYPQAEIRKRAVPMLIRGIAENEHSTSDYIVVRFFFKGIRDGKPVVASFVREMTLVRGLQAKLLIGMDILDSEMFDIILSKKVAVIQSCRVAIPLSCTVGNKEGKAPVRVAKDTKIPPRQYSMVQVSHGAAFCRDSIFEPTTERVSCFAALANDRLKALPVRNDSDSEIILKKNLELGFLAPMEDDCQCFLVDDPEAAELALRKPQRKKEQDRILGEMRDFTTSEENTVKHPSGVTIFKHDNPRITQALYDLITEYEDVFKDTGFALVDEDLLPVYHLKPGWENQIPKKCKIYNVNDRDQDVIDKTMDDLESKNVVYKNLKPVPMSFPVFVIWRTLRSLLSKGRMVVDVRNFNDINLPDSYPMKSQDEMLGKVQGRSFISLLDAIAFYYQWLSHPRTRWAMTVNTRRGQYTFNSLVMGYKNSNAYVQRQMDHLLLPIEAADCYCDDICVASFDFPQHYADLESTLSLLREKNISIGPSKSFIGFPSAVVLGRLVDSFGLATTKERLEAIARLTFPNSLKDLETFIGMAGYMRSNVPYFAQIMEPLEKRKTDMLRGNRSNRSKGQRKRWASSVPIDVPTTAELRAFEDIKAALTKNSILHYYSTDRPLCIDFDVSRYGIGVAVYHVAEQALSRITKDGQIVTYPASTSMNPIAFLSRTLSAAEKKYWPSEMEVLGFVWALRKTEHWINTAKAGVFVFTDHKAIIGMMKHRDLVTSTALSNKNLRLVRAMEYVSKFEITVLHKPGKQNVIPDALSRLPGRHEDNDDTEGQLDYLPDEKDEVWVYSAEILPALKMAAAYTTKGTNDHSKGVALMEIHPEFRKKIQAGYFEDPKWKNALEVLKKNMKLSEQDQADLPFVLRDGLLWKRSDTTDRLCIPRNCSTEIFELLHGKNHTSPGRFEASLLNFVLDRRELSKYIKACPDCSLNKLRTHKPYGSLQPILSPPCPFHTITIDIALGLPESTQGNNAFMATICKLSKATQIIPGRHDWTAKLWAEALMNRLLTANWGFPKIMLSDRDRKFLAELWQNIWKRLGTRLLYATAYHPATDGQTERMILTIKSTFRYYFHSLIRPQDWEDATPRLQFEMNNAKASTTSKSPNEIILGFTPNFILDAFTQNQMKSGPEARIEAHDAIATTSMTMKKYYDARHKPMFFEVGQKVLLRLHKGYNVPKAEALGRKLGQQYAGPFTITERIGRSAYKLDFPSHFKIHNVISVDHLEPAPPMDVFGRALPHAGEVHLECHSRKIIGRRADKYLVEYIGLGSEYHKWMKAMDLGEDALELIEDYKRRESHKL